MAELTMKKWQLGRVLTAKKHGKSRILRLQTYFSYTKITLKSAE